MSNGDFFASARSVAEKWLTTCLHHEPFSDARGYVAWTYARDARHNGTLELIDDDTLSQGCQRFAMSVALDLPPLRTAEDALMLFALADWLDGITIVTKEFGADGALMLQVKGKLNEVTEAALNTAFKALVEAKKFFEEE